MLGNNNTVLCLTLTSGCQVRQKKKKTCTKISTVFTPNLTLKPKRTIFRSFSMGFHCGQRWSLTDVVTTFAKTCPWPEVDSGSTFCLHHGVAANHVPVIRHQCNTPSLTSAQLQPTDSHCFFTTRFKLMHTRRLRIHKRHPAVSLHRW